MDAQIVTISFSIFAAAGVLVGLGLKVASDARAFQTSSEQRLRRTTSLIRAGFIQRTAERVVEIVEHENNTGTKAGLSERVQSRLAEPEFRQHILEQTAALEEAAQVEEVHATVIRRRRTIGNKLIPFIALVLVVDGVLFAFFPLLPDPASVPAPIVITYGVSVGFMIAVGLLAVWQFWASNRSEADFDRIVEAKTRFLD